MIFNLEGCGGCNTCEIACSYRFTGIFNHHKSAIVILETEDKVGFNVELIDKEGTGRFVCDACQDLDEPVCVQYCHKADELKKMIQEYKRECLDKKDKKEASPNE